MKRNILFISSLLIIGVSGFLSEAMLNSDNPEECKITTCRSRVSGKTVARRNVLPSDFNTLSHEEKLKALEHYHRAEAMLYDPEGSPFGEARKFNFHKTNENLAFEARTHKPCFTHTIPSGQLEFWATTSQLPTIYGVNPKLKALINP